jgi:hypothetical protein
MKIVVCLPFVFLILLGTLVPSSGQIIDVPQVLGIDRTVDQSFDRLNDSVERAKNAALAVEYQTNVDMAERIKQIDDVVGRTMLRFWTWRGLLSLK